jgi:hypothetical protein
MVTLVVMVFFGTSDPVISARSLDSLDACWREARAEIQKTRPGATSVGAGCKVNLPR